MQISAQQVSKLKITPEAYEIAAFMVGMEDGEVVSRDIVISRRDAINRNGTLVLDEIPIVHLSYNPLSYMMLSPDCRNDGIKEW